MIDNQQKYLNYKEQFKRLNRAILNGYNLEAMFIAYSIIEDRTKAILIHINKYESYLKKCKNKPSLYTKITYIQKTMENDKLLKRYFSDDLLDKILKWKNLRNDMVHDLLNQKTTSMDLVDLACTGRDLAKRLRNMTTNHRNALARKSSQKFVGPILTHS